jgi:hypothetical protein
MYGHEEELTLSSRTRKVRLTVKRGLFGLMGMMVLAVVCFSSTIPASVWLAAQEDGGAAKPAVRFVSRSPIVSAHAPRNRPASAASKDARNRRAPQTTQAMTGCKEYASSDGEPAVPGKKRTSQKTQDNSKEKSPCNTENLPSR